MLNKDLRIDVLGVAGIGFTGNVTATGRTITKTGTGQRDIQAHSGRRVGRGKGHRSHPPGQRRTILPGTSVVGSLGIGTAKLDLGNNSLVIDYSGSVGPLVDITRQHLAAGRIFASLKVPQTSGLGYGDNSVLNKTSFVGQNVDFSSILIRFTYLGDTDLDGDVDVADLGNLATNWQSAGPWTGGDFDYNGTVDVNDLGLLATNWQAGANDPLASDFISAARLGLPETAVPEPVAG